MDIPIEFYNDTSQQTDDAGLYEMVEERIHGLAQGHTDITGASVNIKQPSQKNETPYIFEATVVIYIRPENIAATEKDGDIVAALKGALDAAERQVYQKREKHRNY